MGEESASQLSIKALRACRWANDESQLKLKFDDMFSRLREQKDMYIMLLLVGGLESLCYVEDH